MICYFIVFTIFNKKIFFDNHGKNMKCFNSLYGVTVKYFLIKVYPIRLFFYRLSRKLYEIERRGVEGR